MICENGEFTSFQLVSVLPDGFFDGEKFALIGRIAVGSLGVSEFAVEETERTPFPFDFLIKHCADGVIGSVSEQAESGARMRMLDPSHIRDSHGSFRESLVGFRVPCKQCRVVVLVGIGFLVFGEQVIQRFLHFCCFRDETIVEVDGSEKTQESFDVGRARVVRRKPRFSRSSDGCLQLKSRS